MLNINPGHNASLLNACRTLGDYSEYSARVRLYAKSMSLEAAVETAIDACIKDDILAGFLRKNRAEAKSVSIYEYDEEKHMQHVREEGHEAGLEAGRLEMILRMKQSGLPIEEIARISGLSSEEINKLENEKQESVTDV